MKINMLVKVQSPLESDVLYAPELEMPESPNVAEKCYPAVRVNDHDDFFYILSSEVGEYEEYSTHPALGLSYQSLGGKEEVERRFAEMVAANSCD